MSCTVILSFLGRFWEVKQQFVCFCFEIYSISIRFFNYNAKVINSAKFRQLIPDFKSAMDSYKGQSPSGTLITANPLLASYLLPAYGESED